MFRLASQALLDLPAEALAACERFLDALPPAAQEHLRAVRLFGPQARRFEPQAPFCLLALVERRSLEAKAALAVACAAMEAGGDCLVDLLLVTPEELASPAPPLARSLQNARREGVDLWLGAPGAFA